MELQRPRETSIRWSNLDLGMRLMLRFLKFRIHYSLAVNLQLMMRRRRHGCANVRPLFFRNFQMHFRLARSDISMMAAWGRAAGHHQTPSLNRHTMILNAILNWIMFDLRGITELPANHCTIGQSRPEGSGRATPHSIRCLHAALRQNTFVQQ